MHGLVVFPEDASKSILHILHMNVEDQGNVLSMQ